MSTYFSQNQEPKISIQLGNSNGYRSEHAKENSHEGVDEKCNIFSLIRVPAPAPATGGAIFYAANFQACRTCSVVGLIGVGRQVFFKVVEVAQVGDSISFKRAQKRPGKGSEISF